MSLQVPTVQTTPEHGKNTHGVIMLCSFTCIHVHFALFRFSDYYSSCLTSSLRRTNKTVAVALTKAVQGTYGLMGLEGSLSYDTKPFRRMEKAPKRILS